MDLYTLTSTFVGDEVVDDFQSAIWTERYSLSGDTTVTVPATEKNIDKLAPGTFLALSGSDEVMILETQDIKDGLLTVVGKDLLEFLNQRNAWFRRPDFDASSGYIVDRTVTDKPGEAISDVVYKMVINPTPYTSPYNVTNLQWADELIYGLTLGAIDSGGVDERLTFSTGPLYDSIRPVAEKYKLGIKLILESIDPIAGYSLKFITYRGRELTSDQTTYPLVRLSPELDTLGDIKEVRSNANFKNVAYVFYQNTISTHYLDPLAPIPEGFDRRSMVVDAVGEPTGHTSPTYTGVYVAPADITAFRAQQAKDALANHNYVRAVDGQASPISDYEYGKHYLMGDIIELEGFTGAISKARITEYIRTQDGTGERAYPTISVVDDDE